MTTTEWIANLRARINPAYADQQGTGSWERKISADMLEQIDNNLGVVTQNALLMLDAERKEKDKAEAEVKRLRAVIVAEAEKWEQWAVGKGDIDNITYWQEFRAKAGGGDA